MWVIYLQQRRGFSLTEATIIDVAFWIAATLGEVPTGVVADTYGRKTSIAVGVALMSVSIIAWAFAPTMPLIMLAYMGLAVGVTFLSGAEDAFFYESAQMLKRGDDYTRLFGRVTAVLLGATAVGNVASGLFASVDLIAPFLIAGLSLLLTLGIALTFKEPKIEEKSGGQPRKSYQQILRQSLATMRQRPHLRYAILYLVLVPVTAVMMETFFLQPQTVSLGVPIAAVGVVVMGEQLATIAGSTWSDRIKARFGDRGVLYAAPAVIVSSLILLALFQIFPALVFIALIGFVTAVLRPLVLNRIQNEVPDDIRATILSMQSLMFTLLVALGEPILGSIADYSGLPAAYVGLAGSLSLLILGLFWKSHRDFP
jgi:MFS family permease